MTIRSSGNVLNRWGAVDSEVALSLLPETTVLTPESETTSGQSVMYISDDSEAREFAVYDGANLKIYNVFPGLGTIELTSTTAFAPDLSEADEVGWLGLKKVSSILYYVYFYVYNNEFWPLDKYLRVNRISIVPGTGGSEEVLEEYTVDIHWWSDLVHISYGRKWYYAIGLGTPEGNAACYTFAITIYSLDMDTGTIATEVEWDSGGTEGTPHGTNHLGDAPGGGPPPVVMACSLGTLHWASCYVVDDGVSHPTFAVVDGDDTEIFDQDDLAGPDTYGHVGVIKYNSRDYIFRWGTSSWATGDVLVTLIPGGDFVYYYDPDLPAIVSPSHVFISDTTFPGIYTPDAGENYYWVTPTTGLAGSKIELPDVAAWGINCIYPTLDLFTGDVYMDIAIFDEEAGWTYELVTVTPNTNTVARNFGFSIHNSAYDGFNHGNYFCVRSGITYWVEYLMYSVANMIIEMN